MKTNDTGDASPGRKKPLTLSVPEGGDERLSALALEWGYTWGKRGNPSALLAAIVTGELTPVRFDAATLHALEHAALELSQASAHDEVRALLALLERAGGSDIPEVQGLRSWLATMESPLRTALEQFIAHKQPFDMRYTNRAGVEQALTVVHARIRPEAHRFYLEVTSLEEHGNREIKPLRKNWVLRLDRVQAAEPVSAPMPQALTSPDELAVNAATAAPAGVEWQHAPPSVTATLRMTGSLAHTYMRRAEDLRHAVEEDFRSKRRTLTVEREVTSSFWFLRDVLRHGSDCEVLGPHELRALVQAEVAQMHQRYQG